MELDLGELQRLARRPNVLEGHEGVCFVSMMINIVHFSRLARLEELDTPVVGRWRDDRLYARERLSGRALGAGGGSDRATEAAACQIGTASARVCPMAPTIAGGWMRVGRRRP